MIDTDKYERMLKDETYRLDGRNNMMALTLLAEVKRLREQMYFMKWVKKTHPSTYNKLKKAHEGAMEYD
tara:strand:+ start:205 stop:411 length:207 start_codon:yes stop_codon:yes gene_type:complete